MQGSTVAYTAFDSLIREGARTYDPDWRDFFSIGVQDIIDSEIDRSFERKLQTSVDREIERQQAQTIRNVKRRIARREITQACPV
jgi:hypothetical protein